MSASTHATGVPGSYAKTSTQDPSVALCIGTYDVPTGVGVSYERGTPVPAVRIRHPPDVNYLKLSDQRLLFKGILVCKDCHLKTFW